MRVEGELRRGHNFAWPLGGAIVWAALLALLGTQDAITLPVVLSSALALTVLSFVVLIANSRAARGSRHQIGADTRGLSIDGQLVVPRHAIARTILKDKPSPIVVVER